MQDLNIRHIAKLARLKLSEEELQGFEKDMGAIVSMVEKLLELKGNIAISAENAMELREDIVTPSMDRDAILANAQLAESGCFAVPKIVE